MLSGQTSCPTCGSPVVVMGSDEGTQFYVPANQRQHTDALLLLQRLAEWDHMQTAGDGSYWLGEIRKVLDA